MKRVNKLINQYKTPCQDTFLMDESALWQGVYMITLTVNHHDS